jgi:hypothetical protein
VIISNIDHVLPVLTRFIEEFNNVVSNNDITVITNHNGDMSIDVPLDMPKDKTQFLSNRIGMLDRYINTNGSDLQTLFQKAQIEQDKLKALNCKEIPQISKQIQTFIELNKSYKN